MLFILEIRKENRDTITIPADIVLNAHEKLFLINPCNFVLKDTMYKKGTFFMHEITSRRILNPKWYLI